ncbi:MAG: PQQ-binding-like beta-propeller repeat protein, partial [Candidatus Eremiobacteraeota bacterium]|nr:PQQ-binding-like beta-propeller repeat protein [Candidatus Eremiobacteraeota bacterium]
MNWPHYANGYDAQRFAPVDQITPANIASLTKVCSIRLGDDGPFQSSPLVISGIMYVTTAHTTVALDASDCALKWRSVYSPGRREVYGANRGVAYLNGRLFRGTPDGSLIALDSSTGRMIWKVDPADPQRGEFLSSAPLAWQGLVFIGTAGSDWGVKGRMMAFRASDGKEAWHFDTIPTGRETGANTWAWAPSTLTGGGGMWTSYSLDEGTGELFVPVGNPAPDFSPARRPGANLFTDSLVVLDARSGRLHWWYQLVPHDSHDYDLGAPAMLYRSSRGANIAAAGGKDGYVHAIDRATHNALFKTAVTTISNSAAVPTTRGVLVCPGSL